MYLVIVLHLVKILKTETEVFYTHLCCTINGKGTIMYVVNIFEGVQL